MVLQEQIVLGGRRPNSSQRDSAAANFGGSRPTRSAAKARAGGTSSRSQETTPKPQTSSGANRSDRMSSSTIALAADGVARSGAFDQGAAGTFRLATFAFDHFGAGADSGSSWSSQLPWSS